MCKQAGIGNEPRTVLEEIKNLTLIDVVLQTRTGTEIRLRCVSKRFDHWRARHPLAGIERTNAKSAKIVEASIIHFHAGFRLTEVD